MAQKVNRTNPSGPLTPVSTASLEEALRGNIFVEPTPGIVKEIVLQTIVDNIMSGGISEARVLQLIQQALADLPTDHTFKDASQVAFSGNTITITDDTDDLTNAVFVFAIESGLSTTTTQAVGVVVTGVGTTRYAIVKQDGNALTIGDLTVGDTLSIHYDSDGMGFRAHIVSTITRSAVNTLITTALRAYVLQSAYNTETARLQALITALQNSVSADRTHLATVEDFLRFFSWETEDPRWRTVSTAPNFPEGAMVIRKDSELLVNEIRGIINWGATSTVPGFGGETPRRVYRLPRDADPNHYGVLDGRGFRPRTVGPGGPRANGPIQIPQVPQWDYYEESFSITPGSGFAPGDVITLQIYAADQLPLFNGKVPALDTRIAALESQLGPVDLSITPNFWVQDVNAKEWFLHINEIDTSRLQGVNRMRILLANTVELLDENPYTPAEHQTFVFTSDANTSQSFAESNQPRIRMQIVFQNGDTVVHTETRPIVFVRTPPPVSEVINDPFSLVRRGKTVTLSERYTGYDHLILATLQGAAVDGVSSLKHFQQIPTDVLAIGDLQNIAAGATGSLAWDLSARTLTYTPSQSNLASTSGVLYAKLI